MIIHEITSGAITARILPRGAELCSLRGPSGLEYIWQAHEPWMRHGPTLFPIIGRLVDDEYRLNGRTYKLGIHGFAPHKEFRWTERTATHCTLELTDDEETRAVYPFPFALSVTHAVEATALTVTYTLTDTGDATLPASIGTHPGFNWPLLPGASKDGHCIVFSNDPGTPVFRGTDGLIQPEPTGVRLTDRSLPLAEFDLRRRRPPLRQPVIPALRNSHWTCRRGHARRFPQTRHLDAPTRSFHLSRMLARPRQPDHLHG